MTPAERLTDDLRTLHEVLPNRDRDLVSLDLETTGFSPTTERIIEISIARLTPAGEVTCWESLVNPQRQVPAEILELTGIRQADLDQAEPWTARLATIVVTGLKDCDFLGYNAKHFDLFFLREVCAQVGVVFDASNARIVDPYVLWGKVEKRDLTAFVERFAGRPHAGAHRATVDVAGTVAGLVGFLRTFPAAPRSVQGIHDLCFPRDPSWADAEGKLAWNSQGELCVNFGIKHKGRPVRQVPRDYFQWMLSAQFAKDTKQIVQDFLFGGKLPPAPFKKAAPATDDAPF